MKFFPSKADTYVWMQPKVDGTSYQYIAVYIDDLLIAMEDLAELCKILKNKYGFQLKGDSPLMYHLGLDYVTDDHGTLHAIPNDILITRDDLAELCKILENKYGYKLKGDSCLCTTYA